MMSYPYAKCSSWNHYFYLHITLVHSTSCLPRSERYTQIWDTLCHIANLRWETVNPSSNPQAGGPPLVVCPPMLIRYIRSYLPLPQATSSKHYLKRAMPPWHLRSYRGCTQCTRHRTCLRQNNKACVEETACSWHPANNNVMTECSATCGSSKMGLVFWANKRSFCYAELHC